MVIKFSTVLALMLAFLTSTSHAQQPPKRKTPVAVWKEVKNEPGNFAAEFPGFAGPSVGRSSDGAVDSAGAFHQDRQGTQYSIKTQMYLGDRTEAELVAQVGGKVFAKHATEKKDIKLGKHPGFEFSADKTEDGESKTVRGRVFAVKNFVILITVTSNPDVVVPEEDIVRYFNSFRLLDEEGKATVAVAKAVVPKKTEPEPKFEPVVRKPAIEEKFVPAATAYDPKLTAAERSWLPELRKLPQPAERRVECLGCVEIPWGQQGFAFSPDGKWLAVVGPQELRMISTATGRPEWLAEGFEVSFPAGSYLGKGLHFSPDGKILLGQRVVYKRNGDKVVPGQEKYFVRMIDAATGETIRDVPMPNPVMSCALSSDGSTLSTVTTSPVGFGVAFSAWNTKDWSEKGISFPEGKNCGWCFSPSGDHLIIAERKFGQPDKPNPPVEAWNLLTGNKSTLPVKHAVLHLSMNADNRTLLVTTAWSPENQCEYHAVDLVTGDDRKIFKGQSPGGAGRLTPDGKYLLVDTPVVGSTVVTRLLDAATGKELWSQENGSSENYLISPGGTLFVRTPYFLAEHEADVFALDDMLNPKWAETAGAMDKARAAGWYVNPYGNHLRAKAYSSNFNEKSLPELAKTLPQTTIVEFREMFHQGDNILKGLPELAKLPGLERLEFRQSIGGDSASRKPLADCKNLKRLEISDGDLGLEYLKDCPKLEELTVSSHKDLTDAGLKKIFAIKTLRKLKFDWINLKVTNDGFAGIGQLAELRSIAMRGVNGRVSSAVFAHWKKCPKLESVQLTDAEMTDAEVAVLATMPQLTEIYLNPNFTLDPKFTDAGVASLAPLKNLRALRIETSNKLTPKGLQPLDLSKLEVGWFGGIQFMDEDMAMLKSMTGLRELWLTYGKYTDRGLDQLKGMTHLRRLHLSTVGEISGAKIRELQKALPRTVIGR